MGSPKKIASPYSGLLGIFASLCCVQGSFVAQKSALTDGQQASSDGHQGASNFSSLPHLLDLRTSHLDPNLIRALMGQGRAFLPARQVR